MHVIYRFGDFGASLWCILSIPVIFFDPCGARWWCSHSYLSILIKQMYLPRTAPISFLLWLVASVGGLWRTNCILSPHTQRGCCCTRPAKDSFTCVLARCSREVVHCQQAGMHTHAYTHTHTHKWFYFSLLGLKPWSLGDQPNKLHRVPWVALVCRCITTKKQHKCLKATRRHYKKH